VNNNYMPFSEETGIPPLSVQSMVRSSDHVDEEQLKDGLRKEARQRLAYEVEHLGEVPKAGDVIIALILSSSIF
jgi:hypothetical protein